MRPRSSTTPTTPRASWRRPRGSSTPTSSASSCTGISRSAGTAGSSARSGRSATISTQKRSWDLRLGLGKEKIFEVRALYNDLTFIDEFLTADFCRDHKLFSFSWSSRNERYEIESREFKVIKDKLLFQLTNAGHPFIYVEDANYENRASSCSGTITRGWISRTDYAREVLRSLVRIWKRPVSVQSVSDGKPIVMRYDGREQTTRHGKP